MSFSLLASVVVAIYKTDLQEEDEEEKKIQVNFWSSYLIPEYILLCWCGRIAFFVGIYSEMRDQHALINLLTKGGAQGV